MEERSVSLLVPLSVLLMVFAFPSTVGTGAEQADTPMDPQSASPWPMWGGSLTHNRTSSVRLVEGREFYKAWEVQVGSWRGSSFVVSSNGTSYATNESGDLIAVGPDGNILWKFDGPGSAVDSCPFIGKDGTVYYSSTCDNLFAIYPNGTLMWNISLDSGIGPSSTPPIVTDDGTVFLGVGGHKLFAIASNGTLKWKLNVKGCIYTSPAMDREGRIVLNTAGGVVYCVSTNGTVIWERDIGAYAHSTTSVTMAGEVVLCDDEGRVHCLRPNGSIKWIMEGLGSLKEGFAVSDEGDIYGTFSAPGLPYLGQTSLLRLSPEGNMTMRYNLSGGWGPPVIMDKGQVILPGPGIHVFGSRRDSVWSDDATLRCAVPVNEYEFRALTDNGYLLSIKGYKVPRVVNITAQQVSGGVLLRWSPPEGLGTTPVNYTISRAVQGGSDEVEIGWTDGTEFLDDHLPQSRSLIYRITAEARGEVSRPSTGYHVNLKNNVEHVYISCFYLDGENGVMVRFMEIREERYEYLDTPIEEVQVHRSVGGEDYQLLAVLYPSDENVAEGGRMSHVSKGGGVHYDWQLEPGNYHAYHVAIRYANGAVAKSATESVYVPDIEVPITTSGLLREHAVIIFAVVILDVIAVAVMLAVVVAKGRRSRQDKHR